MKCNINNKFLSILTQAQNVAYYNEILLSYANKR